MASQTQQLTKRCQQTLPSQDDDCHSFDVLFVC